MEPLKIYFCILSKDDATAISVHRELKSIGEIWRLENREQVVGLIHLGFIRPKIKKDPTLFDYQGQIISTAAFKWVAPQNFIVSESVLNNILISGVEFPYNLVLRGFDYEADEPKCNSKPNSITHTHNNLTLTSAALEILNNSLLPLNKEEIFARIIEEELYVFSNKKPVSILEKELNKYSKNDNNNESSIIPLYGKTNKETYYSLEKSIKELSGWVLELVNSGDSISRQVLEHGIYNESSFQSLIASLPEKLQDQIGLFRYNYLIRHIDKADPNQVLNIIPEQILIANIGSLGLPIRIFNVLDNQDISCLKQLCKISVKEMLTWANFGNKSIKGLCFSLMDNVDKLSKQVAALSNIEPNKMESNEGVGLSNSDTEPYHLKLVSSISFKTHFENNLKKLKSKERLVIEYRTGYKSELKTLDEVGKLIGVTRERVRQIQNKCIKEIIENEEWDDSIAIKINKILDDKDNPVYLETLEVEDSWFKGFVGNYQHLAILIEIFSQNEIKVIEINGLNIVTRINQKKWDLCIKNISANLKKKAKEKKWTKKNIDLIMSAKLHEYNAIELMPILVDQFNNYLQYDGEEDNSILIQYGKSAENIIMAVLHQVEKPLHFSEIAKIASKYSGKSISERRAQNALINMGIKIFGRGIYGLEKFNTIPPEIQSLIIKEVENILYNAPITKQWHSKEILKQLNVRVSSLPQDLDTYTLRMILDHSEKLTFLNRMVWARSDSGQTSNDRVDMADAFTKILEDNDGPLKGAEIKKRLQDIRGVATNLQLQPTKRMIQIGPDYWGLIDRDINGTIEENNARLKALFDYLSKSNEGIHVSEVNTKLAEANVSIERISSYALFNLAQRDKRFYLGKSMLLGLSSWDGDTRRLNVIDAVRLIIGTMEKPLSLKEIKSDIDELTGLSYNLNAVSRILNDEGLKYNADLKKWNFKQ